MGASSSPYEAWAVAVDDSIDLLGNRVGPVFPDHVVDSLTYLLHSSLLHEIVGLLDHPIYRQKPLPYEQQNQEKLSAEPYINVVAGKKA